MAAALTFKAQVAAAGCSGQRCYGSKSCNELSRRPIRRIETCSSRVMIPVVASARAKARPQPRVGPPEIARVDVVSFDGTPVGQEEMKMQTAGPNSEHVVHRKLIQELANRRAGTASTKTRSEVNGGGKKPYKQKGTGRARQGSTRTPLRPGGGVSFGPKPKDWSHKMNKKEKRLAISSAIQSAAVDMTIVEDIDDKFPEPKTSDMAAALERWGVNEDDKALLITMEKAVESSKNVTLSARNIPYLTHIDVHHINIYDILRADKIVVTKSAMSNLVSRYSVDSNLPEEE